MSDAPVGWTFLRSRRWIGYFALFVVFSIACVYLGNWQFDRRAEARAEIDRIDRNYDAPAVDLRDALPGLDGFDEDEQKWLSVTMTGSYLGEAVLARNRPGPSGVGANIIDAFLTRDGRVFFVDRGWILANGTDIDDALAELPSRPEGEVTVVSRLRASEPEIAGRSAAGLSVASINLTEISEVLELDGEVITGAYGMLVSETPSGEHGVLPPRPERDEGPHLSYALQWYVFILIAGIGVTYAARQEYKNLNAGSAEVRASDARRAERRRRRGMSDADEEDALLDA